MAEIPTNWYKDENPAKSGLPRRGLAAEISQE
jgi:hypothetical protein